MNVVVTITTSGKEHMPSVVTADLPVENVDDCLQDIMEQIVDKLEWYGSGRIAVNGDTRY